MRRLLWCLPLLLAAAGGYRAEMERWRAVHESGLKQDDGWLTVTGLFWLKDGPNAFGSAAGSPVQLPGGPPVAGTFELRQGKVRVTLRPGVRATLNNRPFQGSVLLQEDTTGKPDVIRMDRVALMLLGRGGRYAIRLKDRDSEFRRHFTGLKWFPVKESYRVTARMVPHPNGFVLKVPNVLGQVSAMPSPGEAVFRLNGKEYRLTPVAEGDSLFFIFRDLTSGKETYGSGRFLYTPRPVNRKVVLDFNQAENPPCAFTPYATCPLPPKQNRLPVRIEAGEQTYGHGH